MANLALNCVLVASQMYKNVSLTRVERNGKLSWRLLDPDGNPLAAFEVFALVILNKYSRNTRISYCRNLAIFFDYLFEAISHLSYEKLSDINQDVLRDVMDSYDEYLVYGEGAGNNIAKMISGSMPSPMVSKATSALMHAPIRIFLKLSETVRVKTAQMNEAGISSSPSAQFPLYNGLGAKHEVGPHQKQAMIRNSVIASVISGGPRYLKEGILPVSTQSESFDRNRAFPFDVFGTFLESLTTYRDKALYAFCAASGCRISEALQLLVSDVDERNQTVVLVEPLRRMSCNSYMALEPLERDQLDWKGRATELTLLIEPFSSMFFENLAKYYKTEYRPHGQHEFIFQYSRGNRRGAPYFLSAESSRNELFKRAVKASNCPRISHLGGPHSLRHMYGTYLLNYFPRTDGTYGLPMEMVQKIMGHRNIRSTEKYARHDRDLLEEELRYANLAVFHGNTSKTLLQLTKESLESKLEKVKRAISIEESPRLNGNV